MENQQILLYIKGSLQGQELQAFEKRMKLDKLFRQEVELYKDVLIGIQAYDRAKLKKKLVGYTKEFAFDIKEEPKVVKMPILQQKWVRVAIAASFLLFAIGYSWMAYQVTDRQIIREANNALPVDSSHKESTTIPLEAPKHASGGDDTTTDKKKKMKEVVEIKDKSTDEPINIDNKPNNYKKTPFKRDEFKIAFMGITEAQGDKDYDNMLEKLLALEKTTLTEIQQEKVTFYKGWTYIQQGDLAQGIQLLQTFTAKETSKYQKDAIWEIALAHLKKGDKKTAKSLFETLTKTANKYKVAATTAIEKLNRQQFFPFL